MNNQQPHLKITSQDISPYVLLPGDPGRVDLILEKLTDAKIISTNREFKVATGLYQGTKITVCSTGIGCPSTAIAVEELIKAGAKYLIRVGTCGGSWQKDIPAGSLAIPTACVRDEGTTKEYALPEFPAIANFKIVQALKESAEKNNYNAFTGINRTHDAFYCPPQSKEKWKDLPIISSEMEASALFLISSLRQVKAGAILAVNSDPETFNTEYKNITETNKEKTAEIVNKTIQTALDALLLLSK